MQHIYLVVLFLTLSRYLLGLLKTPPTIPENKIFQVSSYQPLMRCLKKYQSLKEALQGGTRIKYAPN